MIIGIAIVLFTVNPGNIFTPWLMKISRGPSKTSLPTQKGDKQIPYSTLYTVKPPKPVTARQASKLITAKSGGTFSVTDAEGTVATLVIPPGALEKDTTITMAPLEEVPIDKFTGAIGNGVVIEPEGLSFLKNAQLTFDFKPTKSLAAGTKAVKNTLPTKSAVIHVDHKTGRINVAETTRSAYGSKLTAILHSLSSFPIADMNGSEGARLGQNEIQNGAADAGGACTPAFINAMLRVAAFQQSGLGGSGGDATAVQAVEDCAKSALEEMERRCETDTIHVTRREMLGLNQMLQQFDFQPEAERARELMQSCKRIYSVSADQAVPVNYGQGTYGISAQLCGYLDEQWVGTEIADHTLDTGNNSVHSVYMGDIRFTLPRGGGQFQMATNGTLLVTSPYIPEMQVSSEGDGQIGYYDGNNQITVSYSMYGHADIPLPIQITKQQCESTNEELEQAGM